MRKGVTFTVSTSDRRRLREVMSDGNRPQKHAWRAHIILLSAAGLGTTAIMAEIVRLTHGPPPRDATHWTLRAMAKVAGVAASTVRAI